MTPKLQTPRGLGAGFLLLCLALALPVTAQERLAIKAGHVVTGDGPILQDAMILVVDGRIDSLKTGLKTAPKGFQLVDYSDCYVAAGMIDLASSATASSDLSEPGDAIDWESTTADVLVAGHRDLAYLRSHGVTTVVVMPGTENVISGFAAVAKTLDSVPMLTGRGPIAAALMASVTSNRRMPTSVAGAVQMLQETLSSKSTPPVQEFQEQKRSLLCRVNSTFEIRAAIGIMDEVGQSFTLMTRGTLRDVLPSVTDKKLSIALPSLNFDSSKRDCLLPAELAAGGHRLAFFVGSPKRSAEALRLGAALAVKNGLSAEAGWAALTSEPARMAGVADRIGTLAAGRDADFIVLTGPPMDLSSVIKKTYIQGREAYSRPASSPKKDAQ